MAGHIIYGVNAVAEALRSGHGINRIYVVRGSRARGIDEIVALAKEQRVLFEFVPLPKMNALAETREHQDVAAAVSPIAYVSIDECVAACGPSAQLLVLDRVQHPRNLGMILRTAAGAGVSGVVLAARGGALLDDTVLRSSAGTLFHLPVVMAPNTAQALRTLKDHGFWVYGLDAKGEADVFEMEWPARSVLVVGNETQGLSPGVRKACDALVSIPLAKGIDSLNVAMAAGIALFQVASRLRSRAHEAE